MSSSSSSAVPYQVEHPRQVFVIPEDDWEHRLAAPGEELIDGGRHDIFVNGVTPYLLLQTFDNTDPAEGDVWIWGGQIWARLDGQTIPLVMGELDRWDIGYWDEPGRVWDGACR